MGSKRGMASLKGRERLGVWITFVLSLGFCLGVIFAVHQVLEPFFRVYNPVVLSGIGSSPSFLTLLLVDVLTAGPLSWYLFATFFLIVFLNELSYAPLGIFHQYLQKKREFFVDERERIPEVSIIIPAYNEEKVIEDTVRTLLEIDYPKKEIIVVNDGSTDNTVSVLTPYALDGRIRLITRPNGGKAAALNLGVSVSRGEILVTIDADGAIERRSVSKMVANFRDPDVIAVAGNVKVGNRVNILTKLQAIEYLHGLNLRRRAFDLLQAVDVLPGALASFRKTALGLIGSYDKSTVTEDTDQTLKLVKTQRPILYEPDAVVHTEAPEDMGNLLKQRRRWYGGTFQVLLKHSANWWRYGTFSLIGYPYMITSLVVAPIIEMITVLLMTAYVLLGRVEGVAVAIALLFILDLALSALAIYLDKDDWWLLLYVPLYTLVYRHVLNAFRLATYWDLIRGTTGWFRAARYGKLGEKIEVR
jgi:poly-beta-1,6 N-acetyl-D-glucosamine synthase